jgi:integrase
VKWLQHKHVEVIDGEHKYLRLNLPVSKKHDKPIVTMSNAVRVYARQRELHFSADSGKNMATPEDYVFLPKFKKQNPKDKDAEIKKRRDAALTQLQRQFSVVLAQTKLAVGARGEERSLYSLRHTCIMYRLLYGDGLDLLTLARNARTSPEMIDRFYASHLEGEMNIGAIQSRKKKANRQPVDVA